MCTKIFFSIHSVKISNVFFFLSRGYNLFMAHFKDLVLKNRIQMGKNMRMNFFKQRITIVLLLVVGVYIYTPTTNSNTIVIRCLKKFIRIFFPICILFFRTKSLKWAMNKLYPRLKKKKTLEIFTEWMEKKILVHIKQF